MGRPLSPPPKKRGGIMGLMGLMGLMGRVGVVFDCFCAERCLFAWRNVEIVVTLGQD